MFLPLAFTHVIALFASLVLSLLAIPAFCFLVLKPQPEKKIVVVEAARKAYLPAPPLGPRPQGRPGRRLGRSSSAGRPGPRPRLGTEFMPIMDEGAFDMDFQFLPGISLPESLEMSRKVEERLMEFPELVDHRRQDRARRASPWRPGAWRRPATSGCSSRARNGRRPRPGRS